MNGVPLITSPVGNKMQTGLIKTENKTLTVLFPLFILAIVSGLLIVPLVANAQATAVKTEQSPGPTPTSTPEAALTDREKQMLEIIKDLQERVTKLENAQKPENVQKPA